LKKVIVGMSGGVDSSVSAFLLQKNGYAVEALFMKNWDEDDETEYCTAKTDLRDAQQVCSILGIPLHTANFASEYWENVFEIFLKEYASGRTPNPDVLCNREIKFKVFLEYAEVLGADFIATGHYGRIFKRGNNSQLFKGYDLNKDQTYFLYAVPEESLAKSLFPVGSMDKKDVRLIASQENLVTSNKKDSTGICFIGERRFADFLSNYLPAQPGLMLTPEGKVMGEHQGLMFYTLGQRQGLKIGGQKDSSKEPWYVLSKDVSNNNLYVVQGSRNPLLFSNRLEASSLHWINGPPNSKQFSCSAKVRYRQDDQNCFVSINGDGRCDVAFFESQRAITPGQSIVFYVDDRCLGGGIIERAWKEHISRI
tara:strand:+ start:439 stop:1539 length:1101 start_codon:yes stop_codon:yes gene_type:complete